MSLRIPLLATSALAVSVGWSPAARAVPALGLSGASLVGFDTAAPGTATSSVTISGLQPGEGLFGIDYRPAGGALYALSSASRLYVINTTTGAATLASTLSNALSGTDFDISFNPTVDRLRIVGTSGQNLRVNVDTGAVTVDVPLAYASTDPRAGMTPLVVGAAYTNQVAGATSTTLYDIDSSNASLTTQNPPNNGTLNTVGPLGISGLISFDIDGGTGIAYAATFSTLYTVNLSTGAATSAGTFGRTFSDFTLAQSAPASTVPEPISLALLGAGLAGLAMIRRDKAALAS